MINVYHLASDCPHRNVRNARRCGRPHRTCHWFPRTVVVAAAILATLLIPAYELAYQLGIESLVVVGGLAILVPPAFTHLRCGQILKLLGVDSACLSRH